MSREQLERINFCLQQKDYIKRRPCRSPLYTRQRVTNSYESHTNEFEFKQ